LRSDKETAIYGEHIDLLTGNDLMSLALDPNDPAALGPSAAPADLIKESDTANFGTDVIEPSMEVPIIVDFWAPWCGPCKQLGPLLEKLVTQAGGLVRMVKINVDENKELAGQLRIQSIPAVFAFKDGQPADGFVGAQTERQIKDFIGRLIGDAKTPLDAALEQAKTAMEEGNIDAAGAIYMDVMRQDPENTEAISGLIRCSVAIGKLEHAQEIITQLDDKIKIAPEVAAAISALELAQQSDASGDTADLRQKVDADPGDHQSRFDLAMALYGAQQNEEALRELLELFRRDRAWDDEAARKQMIKIFEALGHDHPTTMEIRKELTALIYS
jgi:putative thioredoxin